MKYRSEKDSIGLIQVPADKYWGAQTERSRQNFKIGPSGSMPMELIHSMAVVKLSSATANTKLNVLEAHKAKLINEVCQEIIDGELEEQFPLVIWQTGSGTQTNMNLNEVIANRAWVKTGGKLGEKNTVLHPNDDVNKSQSSNDTFPTAMHIALVLKIEQELLPELKRLKDAFHLKSKEFDSIIKVGRTHLMDATPITLGQEFSAYSSQLARHILALKEKLNGLKELPIGGTAVGTGLNAPKGFDHEVVTQISKYTQLEFKVAQNKFEHIASHDSVQQAHSVLKDLASSLLKIGNDIRMLASGPRAGLAELKLPANEPGSSIMPGKVNPTQIEALTMVCAKVIGNDTSITIGNLNGQFQLNAYKPLIGSCAIESIMLLTDAVSSFNDNCLGGVEPNIEKIAEYLDRSLMVVTALNPVIGYEKAAIIAKAAFKNNTTLKEEAIQHGFLSAEEFDKHVNPNNMI